MAAVIEPLMNGVGAPWLLYGIGAVAIVLNACKIPAPGFCTGHVHPLELNVPLVVGGAVNWYVTSRKGCSPQMPNVAKGTLLASGFIAGGALMDCGKRGNALRRYQYGERRMAQQYMV